MYKNIIKSHEQLSIFSFKKSFHMHSFQSEQPPYANNKPNKSTPFVDTLTPMVSSEPQQHSDFSVRRHENKNNREFDQTLIHSIP